MLVPENGGVPGFVGTLFGVGLQETKKPTFSWSPLDKPRLPR